MNRIEAIQMLNTAKIAHMQWMARAKALVAGASLNKDLIPVRHTGCEFGEWYYGAGRALSGLGAYQDIEKVHEELHGIYQQIFDLIFGPGESSLLKKLFSAKIDQKEEGLLRAKEMVPELVSVSKNLLVLLDALENEINQALN
jgi:hypothetical protein